MKLKIALASATALGLAMGGAALAGNQAYIDQEGDHNSALITQGGSENWAGHANYNSYPDDPILQQGNSNSLIINQEGSKNQAGVSTYGSQYSGTGIDQLGDENYLNIHQLSSNSSVHQVLQESGASSSTTNALSITQSGESASSERSNRVNSVAQTHTGSLQNTATIMQHRTGHPHGQIIGDGSDVSSAIGFGIVQNGSGNTLSSSQVSIGGVNGRNRILYMEQTGEGNTISASQNAHRNLIGEMVGNAGVTDTGIVQRGAGNFAGAAQDGRSNQIETIWQQGDFNQAHVSQSNDDNWATSSQIGNDNVTTIVQSGDDNEAATNVLGDNNHLNVRQEQSGASGNRMAVDIIGDGNNSVNASSQFTGDALEVRDIVRNIAEGDPLFRRGDLFQEGSNNLLSGPLGTPFTVTGNNNTFATFQNGNDNTIVGDITGSNNQAVVAQIGNGNTADMSQVGNGNNLGISQ